jgi:hypothetical protein
VTVQRRRRSIRCCCQWRSTGGLTLTTPEEPEIHLHQIISKVQGQNNCKQLLSVALYLRGFSINIWTLASGRWPEANRRGTSRTLVKAMCTLTSAVSSPLALMRYCVVHEILRYEPSLRAGHGIHAHCFVMDVPSTWASASFTMMSLRPRNIFGKVS